MLNGYGYDLYLLFLVFEIGSMVLQLKKSTQKLQIANYLIKISPIRCSARPF